MLLVKPLRIYRTVLLFSLIELGELLYSFPIKFPVLLGCQYCEIWRCCAASCVSMCSRNYGTGMMSVVGGWMGAGPSDR